MAQTTSSTPTGSGSNHDRNSSNPSSRTLNPGLYAPPLHNDTKLNDSLRAIIDRLMEPPSYLYSEDGQQVTLNITWAVGVVGRERFEPTPLGRRLGLRQEDDLRNGG